MGFWWMVLCLDGWSLVPCRSQGKLNYLATVLLLRVANRIVKLNHSVCLHINIIIMDIDTIIKYQYHMFLLSATKSISNKNSGPTWAHLTWLQISSKPNYWPSNGSGRADHRKIAIRTRNGVGYLQKLSPQSVSFSCMNFLKRGEFQ